MSEVIDAQAVDSRVEELIVSAPKAEIVETKEEDLSPEDAAQVEKYMSQIDIKDSQLVLQYGAAAQKNVADFSEGALASVKTKDMGEIGSMLTGVVTELKGFSVEEEKGGFLGLFKKGGNQLASLKAKYDKAEVNVNKICKAMEGHQQVLLKDVAMLDKMYDENLDYFKQLSLYIIAGKKKLDEAKKWSFRAFLQRQRNQVFRRIHRRPEIMHQWWKDSKRRFMISNLPATFPCRWLHR